MHKREITLLVHAKLHHSKRSVPWSNERIRMVVSWAAPAIGRAKERIHENIQISVEKFQTKE
jgi:hypothetical protein